MRNKISRLYNRTVSINAVTDAVYQVATKLNEIEAIKKQLREVQGESEIAELRRRRVETDLSNLQRAVIETQRKTDAVKSEYSVMTQALKDSETKAQRMQVSNPFIAMVWVSYGCSKRPETIRMVVLHIHI